MDQLELFEEWKRIGNKINHLSSFFQDDFDRLKQDGMTLNDLNGLYVDYLNQSQQYTEELAELKRKSLNYLVDRLVTF